MRTVPWTAVLCLAVGACGGAGAPRATPPTAAEAPRSTPAEGPRSVEAPPSPRLGVSWPSFAAHDYDAPEDHLARIQDQGFDVVSFVPTYTYAGLDRIDHTAAPSFDVLSDAIAAALARGLGVVVKPHLDPPLYQPGFDGINPSWRAQCPWRGYFDVDPMSDAYREGLMEPTLDAIARALDRLEPAEGRSPLRLDLGSELMNSTVYKAQRWFELVAHMRQALAARGLEGRVQLSHNFSHHIQIPEDFLLRMDASNRRALARYLEALDAIAVSQYMDLTVAMPAEAHGKRLPTPEEVAEALLQHERAFRRDILERHLGLPPERTPPLHIGEFGVGVGGLSRPNVWQGELDAGALEALREEVLRAHEGLLAYLTGGQTTVQSAVLWVTGGTYDVFGWMRQSNGIPDVMDRYRTFRHPGGAGR
jgi:hypothetical protein